MRERIVVDDSVGAEKAKAMAEMIQKIYLGVGKVISTAEAREILTGAGIFTLPGPLPPEPAAPQPEGPPEGAPPPPGPPGNRALPWLR
jgi:hypothetical protein